MKLSLTNQDIGYYEIKFASASTFIETEDNYSPSFFERCFDFIVIKRLINKIKEANTSIEEVIQYLNTTTIPNDKTKQQFIDLHKSIFKFLNRFDKLDDIKNAEFANKSITELTNEILKFHSRIKDMEMKLRLLIYPDRNEIELTYDELKDLREAFKEFLIEE